MTRVKICGVMTPADAVAAADAGADAVGLNFYPQSPRYLDPAACGDILRALPAFTSAVGLFVGTPLRRACAVAYQLGLRAIQDYPDGPPGEDTFPFAYLPAFRVKDDAQLAGITAFVAAAKALGRPPAAVLVDSFVPGRMGGTGHVAPWGLLAGFAPGVPLVLAGGLTPENVADAIRTVRPWGVDVASGVEAGPGRKDAGKMRAFVAAVRGA